MGRVAHTGQGEEKERSPTAPPGWQEGLVTAGIPSGQQRSPGCPVGAPRAASAPSPSQGRGGGSAPALPSWPTNRGLEGALLLGRGRAACRETPRGPGLHRPGGGLLGEARRAAEVGREGGLGPGFARRRGFCSQPRPLVGREEGAGRARKRFPGLGVPNSFCRSRFLPGGSRGRWGRGGRAGRSSTFLCDHFTLFGNSPAAGGMEAPRRPSFADDNEAFWAESPRGSGPAFLRWAGRADLLLGCPCGGSQPTKRVRLLSEGAEGGRGRGRQAAVRQISWRGPGRPSLKRDGRIGAGFRWDGREPPRGPPDLSLQPRNKASLCSGKKASGNLKPSWKESGLSPRPSRTPLHLPGVPFPAWRGSESGGSKESAVIPQRPFEIGGFLILKIWYLPSPKAAQPRAEAEKSQAILRRREEHLNGPPRSLFGSRSLPCGAPLPLTTEGSPSTQEAAARAFPTSGRPLRPCRAAASLSPSPRSLPNAPRGSGGPSQVAGGQSEPLAGRQHRPQVPPGPRAAPAAAELLGWGGFRMRVQRAPSLPDRGALAGV